MVRRTVGHIYGWENAKLVLDYLNALHAPYDAHCHNNVWTITYELLPWECDALPSADYIQKGDTR